MALWGKNDDKTSTGTVAIAANGLVTGTSTLFDSELAVGDYLRANDVDHLVVSITSNTVCQVVNGTNADGTVAVVAASNNVTYSEKPKYVTTSESNGEPEQVFGVDTTEIGVTDSTHAGWVRRTAGTGGRNGRVQYEVLVAGSSITGDAADDTEFADS